MIPSFKARLKLILFKYEFPELLNEFNKSLEVIRKAADQIKNSARLESIFEVR